MVVLPTPGPPVIIETFELILFFKALLCDSSSLKPLLFSTHFKALSKSILGQG